MGLNESSKESGQPVHNIIARDRVKSLSELAEISRQARAENKKVVLAHGVFDLLHLGHVRHLEAARKLGDVLIVTVTADKHVRKGPGRPVFPQGVRAEMLAALGYIDWTGINGAVTAVPLIEAIKPDFYVKGSDYADPAQDVTGKIDEERELVEKCGGQIVFTDEITFSSSALINEHFDIYNPEARTFLDDLRRNDSGERTLELVDRLADLKVLIIGETIVDEYDYVESMGKAAKENIIATRYRGREKFAGGAVAAANHAAGFCNEVEVVTTIGADYEDLIDEHVLPNVKLSKFAEEGRPTIRKKRFVEEDSLAKLFEVYYMEGALISDSVARNIIAHIEAVADNYDVVIVCDFGHGLMVRSIIDAVVANAKFLAVNAQANAGNMGHNLVTKYNRADYVCVDEKEARLAVQDQNSEIETLVTQKLAQAMRSDRIAVTLGARGCICWDRSSGLIKIPAFAHSPVDTIGAGDAFLAVTAPLFAVAGDAQEVGFVGNVVGGIKTGVVGHRQPVEKGAVKNAIVSLLK
tara:strand:+ start:4460 stop:6031 length:1572 start_codon:yes stop_codon:yes gene_type:complete